MQEEFQVEPGVLYLVSTPIGNLRDITLRALDVLSQVGLVAAEDTRRTQILLSRFNISTPTTSYFDYNKERKAPVLIGKLQAGTSIALVSDAGTPGISDPAYYLVRAAIEAGVTVRSIPGASAHVAALVISGLPTDRFVFEGFLPTRKRRRKRLEALRAESRTIVLYESPMRLLRTLKELQEVLGQRRIVVVREITKKFEEVLRGKMGYVIDALQDRSLKGEFVLIVEGLTRRIRSNSQDR